MARWRPRTVFVVATDRDLPGHRSQRHRGWNAPLAVAIVLVAGTAALSGCGASTSPRHVASSTHAASRGTPVKPTTTTQVPPPATTTPTPPHAAARNGRDDRAGPQRRKLLGSGAHRHDRSGTGARTRRATRPARRPTVVTPKRNSISTWRSYLAADLRGEGATVVMTRTTNSGVGPVRHAAGRHRQRRALQRGDLDPRGRGPGRRPGLRHPRAGRRRRERRA